MRKVTLTAFSLALLFALAANAQIVPPAPGVEIPKEVLQSVIDQGPHAFEFQHAWIEKTRQIKAAREAYIDERGFYQRDMIPAAERPRYSVSGTFRIPVFAVKYVGMADPYPIGNLQTKLFNGPFAPRTLHDFYSEISYGDLNLTGTVYGWTQLPNNEAFYAGPGNCNGLCGSANIDDLIITTLSANDGAINFGQYDNDGPDGLANSGDDDGFVDFVAFVHPTQGAECGVNGHIWSHRWVLSGWTGVPYTTNDPRTGGGLIQVNDYVIQPGYNCGGATIIDIGVFCHEFGHAFGLPDLYDTNGGSQGVGHWDLMGSGNWNQPTNPAHMGAWSKTELGWSDVTVVDNPPSNYMIDNVEFNRDIYRLDIMHERWRRINDACHITGNFSMRCALTAAEAAARNWASGTGYGDGWVETLSRSFNFNGTGPVTLSYQYNHNLETNYDYVRGLITVGATTTQFVSYTGAGSGTANINLTPFLGGSPTPYTISFRMTSDTNTSDEDGGWATACGAIVLDQMSVTGGGEAYSTGFETREDGWAPDMTIPNEHFYVENRQPLGSDVNVAGGGGLVVWHVDEAVSHGQGNTGGPGNNRPRGTAVEQADGLFNLENNTNRGDAGDPWPGSGNKTLFNGGTVPNSNGYNGPSTATMTLLTGNGDPITTTLTGGWSAPTITTLTPNTGESGTVVVVQIDGSAFAKVGTAELVLGATAATIPATSLEWVGKDRILATFDLTDAADGFYDMVVFNPYGASGVLAASFEVFGNPTGIGDNPKQFALRANYPNPFNPSTTIRFDVATASHVALRVYDVSGALVRTLVDRSMEAGSHIVQWDGINDQGNPASSGVYFYRLTAPGFSDVRKMTLIK